MHKIFKIYYQNIRGVNSKTNIRSNFSAANYDMIALTETWLQDDFFSSQLFDSSFSVYRSDRDLVSTGKKGGGGCLIALKNTISATRMCDWEKELPYENIWIAINLSKTNKKLYVHVAYIPPNSNHSLYANYFDHYTKIMTNIKPNDDFILLGDYNIAPISWTNAGTHCIPLTYEGRIAADLTNFIEIVNLKQINNRFNINGRLLDLTLVNFDNVRLYEATPLSKLDHQHPTFCLEITESNVKYLKEHKTSKINFFKLDYLNIEATLKQIHWNSLLDTSDIETATNKFYSALNAVINKYAVKSKSKNRNYPNWFSNKLIQILNDKEHYKDLHKATGSDHFHALFKDKRKEFKTEKRKCEMNFIDNTEANIKNNPKAFFSYTKSLCKTNKLPNTMTFNGTSSDDTKTIAEFFASNFKSVYSPAHSNASFADTQCDCANHINIIPTIYQQFSTKTRLTHCLLRWLPCSICLLDQKPFQAYGKRALFTQYLRAVKNLK